MNSAEIVFNQPHLFSKIYYEFNGISTPSCIAFNKALKEHKIIVEKNIGFVIWQNMKYIRKPKIKNYNYFSLNELFYI
tara:strand:- start:2031 stop:2264 length:234 start_codon:yes stop_codon:yes gene_type:complete